MQSSMQSEIAKAERIYELEMEQMRQRERAAELASALDEAGRVEAHLRGEIAKCECSLSTAFFISIQ